VVNSELRRSAISVSSNIAEGCTRWSYKDKARFYEIAFGSLMENLNQLIVAHDLKYISETDLTKMRLLIDEIAKKLSALHRSVKKRG
jgi:four helix bundle protein